jgi:hypothetical protein
MVVSWEHFCATVIVLEFSGQPLYFIAIYAYAIK